MCWWWCNQLYSSLEHLALDFKNIKKSLNCLAKYIGNKNIDTSKANNVEDLKDIGTAAWNLISSIYTSEWDSLYANENKNLFSQKVFFMYTSKAISIKNGKKREKIVLNWQALKDYFLLFLSNSSKRLKQSLNTSKS